MTPLRLLLIHDSESDAMAVTQELARAGRAVSPERVDTPEALMAALERQRWDVAIADIAMTHFSGTAALRLLREYDADMPFIFVSSIGGEDVAVAAIKAGAQDYVMKDKLARLLPAVERELRETTARLSRKRAEARLAHLAYHDPLTGLPNRILLHDRLQQAILGAQRTGEPHALVILDLDGFKTINDSLGHHVGDRILKEVASRLRSLLREVDTVARLGGDEFALMLPRTGIDGAVTAARGILQELRRPFALNGHPLTLGGSLGIAWFPEHGLEADTLLQKADIAMYVAKSGGLGWAAYTADRDRHAHRRLTLTTELRDAIERNQFSFDYQPIVELPTGIVTCVEALARWDHPERGRLLPSEFIDLSEQTGLIEPLTLRLLDRALTEWADPDPHTPIRIALNLSPRSLQDPDLPDRVAELLQAHGASPSLLTLEITENFIITDAALSTASLSRLREMGVTLAIDDFGVGYSSLRHLQRLPVSQLKIDRSFVAALAIGDDAIVGSTIELAHRLGLTVVAEGVESAPILERLVALKCDAAQGSLFADPGSADDIRRWAASRHAAAIGGEPAHDLGRRSR